MDYRLEIASPDTTFVELTKSQIQVLHEEVFGKIINDPSTASIIIKLGLAYAPFLLFIIIMITAINLRWNKAYTRIVKISERIEKTEETEKNVSKLKIQKLNILDRFFVYFVIWICSLYIDGMIMTSGVFTYPWVSIPVMTFVITKKLKRLTETSSLIGVDDSDIINNIEEIIKKMIKEPLFEGVLVKFNTFINNRKTK